MKTVTVRAGGILVAKFEVDPHALITELRINDIPIISRLPLVVTAAYPVTISVEEKP